MTSKRPGYYVEGKYFRDNYHQARARAALLSKQYGRPVAVLFLAHEDVGHPNTAVPYEVSRVQQTA